MIAAQPIKPSPLPEPPPIPPCLEAAREHLQTISYAGLPGKWHVTADSWPAWLRAKDQLQVHGCVRFGNERVRRSKSGQTTTVCYICTRGGRAWFESRNERKQQVQFKRPNAAGVSNKCGCTASITAKLPTTHYRQFVPPRQPSVGAAVQGMPAEGEGVDNSDAEHNPSASVRATLRLVHTGHSPGSPVDMLSLPPDPRVRAIIEELVRDGYSYSQMVRCVPKYVKAMLLREDLPLDLMADTRFDPREDTIINIAQRYARARRMDQVDQLSVHAYVAKQQAKAGNNRWHFRPANKARGERMLLVHQTEDQQRMLLMYGQNIVGMDATYKTSKWGFPLFMINVVTNHGRGFPVAMFVVQEEDQVAVAEALEM